MLMNQWSRIDDLSAQVGTGVPAPPSAPVTVGGLVAQAPPVQRSDAAVAQAAPGAMPAVPPRRLRPAPAAPPPGQAPEQDLVPRPRTRLAGARRRPAAPGHRCGRAVSRVLPQPGEPGGGCRIHGPAGDPDRLVRSVRGRAQERHQRGDRALRPDRPAGDRRPGARSSIATIARPRGRSGERLDRRGDHDRRRRRPRRSRGRGPLPDQRGAAAAGLFLVGKPAGQVDHRHGSVRGLAQRQRRRDGTADRYRFLGHSAEPDRHLAVRPGGSSTPISAIHGTSSAISAAISARSIRAMSTK